METGELMKKIIKNILIYLQYIVNPGFWVSNYPTSDEWDTKLNEMLDNPKFEDGGPYTVKLNGNLVWVSNYPYAYGFLYKPLGRRTERLLPSRKTRIRLRKAVRKFYTKELMKSVK